MNDATARTVADGDGYPDAERPHVVVIGGGVSGLAAAWTLVDPRRAPATGAGARGGGAPAPRVTLLEAGDRLGGKLRTGSVAGLTVDLGAESFLARRPEAVSLARSVGLGDLLEPPTDAKAAVWTRGALRPLPAGAVMGVPGDLAALRESGVLTDEGLARVARDPELPPAPVHGDVSVGEYIASRVGREVVDRLVEPLLGGVYAGHADLISLRAALPQLVPAAESGGSLTEAVRASQRAAAERRTAGEAVPPVFNGLRGGVGQLPSAVADACRRAGARVVTGRTAVALARTDHGWRLTTRDVDGSAEQYLDADAVILAVPAAPAVRLLHDVAPAAAAGLAGLEYASMALVTMAFRRPDLGASPAGSGFLVPPVEGRAIKASTFSSNKWSWVAQGDPDLFVLRTSFGRHREAEALELEDGELVERSLGDLREAIGLTGWPVDATVTRWYDGLPQYAVGHLDRVAAVRSALRGLPPVAVCGAAYDGVGIPACVAGAERAARRIREALQAATPLTT
ncbi:protoporphyrinogen oxidase [Allostreptomyces psammosilenae]|uniref:Coproporphyrinogen III oxidase n=1 Tax=Allostreptomyces psammosilenae TaxID=1892865 RepID=A0A852ZP43_9ACTN|nr:protoporphyrinogen oxidase [Allostreptomyces psammosilenae]NYI03227.1 oxygen-dependent protoporphyrinogen oxidase [Allostreptomyces psammosilenae]